MKKIKQDTVITGLVENGLTGETYEISAAPQDGTFETILPIAARDAMAKAEKGDSKAWGRLYSFASYYIKQGKPIPEPLRGAISKRLSDISSALIHPPETDTRAGVLSAVAPVSEKKVRVTGAKKKVMTVDAVALDVLRYAQAGVFTKKGMSLKAASRKVAAIMATSNIATQYPAESLESAAKRVRKQLRDAANEKKDGGNKSR